MADRPRILVIKLSALGDVVLSVAAFQAIRRHHPDAWIVLLTTRPYVALAEASGLFDAVWTDPRAGVGQLGQLVHLMRRLRAARFARVYDLQRRLRTSLYLRLLTPLVPWRRAPEWVGAAPGASHRTFVHDDDRHVLEREADQLRAVGLEVRDPDLSFLTGDLDRFGLPPRIALLVPGGAPHRPEKRWPAANFAELGRHLAGLGVTPVLLGTRAEEAEIRQIRQACPAARDLHGETGFGDLAELGRRALVAVGNDTGPMHLLAAAGCPAVTLFSHASDPKRNRPHGAWVAVRRRSSLQDLPVEEVIAALPPQLTSAAEPDGLPAG